VVEGDNRGRPGVRKQIIEQLERVVEAEASRAGAVGDDPL
jgi:hypothetical protein